MTISSPSPPRRWTPESWGSTLICPSCKSPLEAASARSPQDDGEGGWVHTGVCPLPRCHALLFAPTRAATLPRAPEIIALFGEDELSRQITRWARQRWRGRIALIAVLVSWVIATAVVIDGDGAMSLGVALVSGGASALVSAIVLTTRREVANQRERQRAAAGRLTMRVAPFGGSYR